MSQNKKLTKTTVFLHWVIGFGMLALLAVGWYMEEFQAYALYDWHKSFGILIIVFALYRMFWRMKQGWLSPASPMTFFEKMIGKVAHVALIAMTILFPISGMLMSGAGGHGLDLFGIQLLAPNLDIITQEEVPLNKELAELGSEMHEFLMWALIVTVVLHILGVIKHQFIIKDRTLPRMLGK